MMLTRVDKIKRTIAVVFIVLMSTQIVAIEGFVYSPVKVFAMLSSPIWILFFGYYRNISKEMVYGVLCILVMSLCSLLSSSMVSWERIGYRAMYFMMFICFTYIVRDGCLNLSYILKLLKVLVIAYGIVILLQHVLYWIGVRQFPLLNFYGSVTMAGVFKPNGLSCEPSHSARIMTILYWGYLKLLEIRNGRRCEFKDVLKEELPMTLLFIISMFSMGSATAMIGILLILFNFFHRKTLFFLMAPLLFILLMTGEFESKSIQRIQAVFNSLFSDDVAETLIRREGSGAVRIMPLVNTFTNLDLFTTEAWIGQGSVPDANLSFEDRVFSENRYIGDVSDFGLLTYLTMLLFVFKCCIKRFFSIQSLIFLCLSMFSVGSVYYTWLMFMVFYLVNYYTEHQGQAMEYQRQTMVLK